MSATNKRQKSQRLDKEEEVKESHDLCPKSARMSAGPPPSRFCR